MAHFARIDDDNTVRQVIVISDDDSSTEEDGQAFIASLGLAGTWVQTSYNTNGAVHALGGIPFRYNYAGTGYTYDADREAFIPPKPYDSWVLVDETCLWEAPVAMPDDGNDYTWNEATTSWVAV